MTSFQRGRYDAGVARGAAIPLPTPLSQTAAEPDFDRLERVVIALVERHREAVRENLRLRGLLEDRDQRLRLLDGQLLELNQRRQDVGKRIDDLVAQIQLLENQFGPAHD